MSSQASSPASPASITEQISIRTIADVVKDFNTEELIEYLGRKNLKLKESHFKILRKEEIAGSDFLKLTKEDFRSAGFALGQQQGLQNSLKASARNYETTPRLKLSTT